MRLDNIGIQYIWNGFLYFFKIIKGYDNLTNEEIETMMNNDDLKEYCEWIMKMLGD